MVIRISRQLASRCLVRGHLRERAIVGLGRGLRGVHLVQVPRRQVVGMKLRLVTRLLERVALQLRLPGRPAPPAPLVYEHSEREEADRGDATDYWSGDPGFTSLSLGGLW